MPRASLWVTENAVSPDSAQSPELEQVEDQKMVCLDGALQLNAAQRL
jgi:hypothetical protein